MFKRILAGVLIFCCTTLASFLIGRWWGKYRASQQWKHKQFLGRVIVSLNTFSEGFLRIRTIFERDLQEVFLNPVAIQKIQSAATKTKVLEPLLPMEKGDRWFLLNFVLNAVAEKFTDGLLRYDASLGSPGHGTLRPVAYLIFLTCEQVGPDRLRKIRAMMIRKDLLEDFQYKDTMPNLEQEWHSDRIVTLRQAAEVYRKEPDNFLTLEVYV
jgi:hypothetical protein